MLLLAAALVVAAATPAAAGGWAVSTLDETPAQLVAGQSQAVGFTIRQHGQTAVNPDSGEIGIRLTSETGQRLTFLAAETGPVDHFVASVEAPAAGRWTWEVLQGWFEPQPLGAIDVVTTASPAAAPAATAGAASAADGPSWWRIGAIAIAALLGAAFLIDLVVGRRRHRGAAVPA